MTPQLTIDLSRASSDFDGDWVCVCEILKEAESDLGGRLSQLRLCDLNDKESYVAVLHEIVNTLGTAWCAEVAKQLRHTEMSVRVGSTALSKPLHEEILDSTDSGLLAVRSARQSLEQTVLHGRSH